MRAAGSLFVVNNKNKEILEEVLCLLKIILMKH